MDRSAATRIAALAGTLLMLPGCDAPTGAGNGTANAAREAMATPPGLATMPLPETEGRRIANRIAPAPSPAAASCAGDRGEREAARLVLACTRVSPATRPPCNVANSCAMIESEIARGCALLGPDAADMSECRPLPDSGAAAADVVRRYYEAINARDFATAWAQWGPDGRPGQSFAAFAAGFERTRSSVAALGTPSGVGSGANLVHAKVPVTITATLENGRRQRFTGTYTVRRVAGAAEPWRRQWHLQTAALAPAPVR